MLNEEIKKKFEVISEAEPKKVHSEEIAEKLKIYVANGGIIKVIPAGVSSEFPDGSLPIRTQKDYKAVHNKVTRKNFDRKKKTDLTKESDKRILGAPCEIDGSRLRYKSGECVMCASARYYRQAKAKREKKVDTN